MLSSSNTQNKSSQVNYLQQLYMDELSGSVETRPVRTGPAADRPLRLCQGVTDKDEHLGHRGDTGNQCAAAPVNSESKNI